MHALLTPSLRDRCLALSATDRAALAQDLICSLGDCGEIRRPKDQMDAFRREVQEQTGVDVRTRDRHAPLPAYKAAFILLCRQRLPVTQTEVSRYLGLNHATVVFHERRMQDALQCPSRDIQLVECYEKLSTIEI